MVLFANLPHPNGNALLLGKVPHLSGRRVQSPAIPREAADAATVQCPAAVITSTGGFHHGRLVAVYPFVREREREKGKGIEREGDREKEGERSEERGPIRHRFLLAAGEYS